MARFSVDTATDSTPQVGCASSTFAPKESQRALILPMPDHDTVLELYGRGILAHDLRRSYVDDQLGDNSYAGFSRTEIEREERSLNRTSALIARDMDEEFFDLYLPLDALKEAEPKATEALSSGQVIGLGFTGPHEASPEVVPSQQWHFLNLDFEKGVATGTDLHYAGLRFLRKGDLTDDQIQAIKAAKDRLPVERSVVTEIGAALNFQAADWKDITLRFLKDNCVEVGGPEQKRRLALGELGLLNRTTGSANSAWVVLLKMANGRRVSKEKKHAVSDLRRMLKAQFGLSSDPFQLEEGRGYVPNFHIVDDRDAADRRAKENAVMVPYDDSRYPGGEMSEGLPQVSTSDEVQDEYPYDNDLETKGDFVSLFLEKNKVDR